MLRCGLWHTGMCYIPGVWRLTYRYLPFAFLAMCPQVLESLDLTPDQMEALKGCFRALDRDQSGWVWRTGGGRPDMRDRGRG